MTVRCFVDTNVLLYALSDRASERSKRQRARALLASEPFGLSVQVLQELFVNARKGGVDPDALDAVLAELRRVPVIESSLSLFDTAVALHRRYEISYWDAAIVAAALELGARTLYSEDLSHGQRYAAVQVVNPFR
ncbi:PIN domain-containing protein [Panacagrimonas sp.]|uniref:PIN domain-containing protein n=1 Tax=Panacagrimonas sp. TaxID=2480088 RepID=UPI003B52DCA7